MVKKAVQQQVVEIQEVEECQCLPVGIIDIADRLKLQPNSISQLQIRGRLPLAQGYVSNSPWWCWVHVIEPWARETGRLNRKWKRWEVVIDE